MRTTKKQPTTLPTQKRSKHEQHKRKPRPPHAYSQAYGQNRQTSNEPPEKTLQVVEEEAAEATVEAEAMAAGETLPRQEDPPQVTPVGEITDSSDNPRTYSPETAQRRRSSSRSGNSITT